MSKAVSSILMVFAICAGLYLAKNIFIPFVVALIIWFIIREVNKFIARINISGRTVPRGLRGIFSFVLIFSVIGLAVSLLAQNISGLEAVIPKYQENILSIKDHIEARTGLDLLSRVREMSGDMDFSSVLTAIINSLSSILGNAFMVILYVVFLMLEEQWFPKKWKNLWSSDEINSRNGDMLKVIDESLSSYVVLKTFISLVTGIASYVVLMILSIDFAFFWAFLIFLLNYIPTIGSLIGTLFPATIAALQFGEIEPAIWVLLGVGVVQLLIGNILEPKLMGNRLNISALVVLLALSAWGAIWGILGAILAVPITVMMIIIFSKIPSTKGIAVLLSEKGEI